VFDVAHGRMHVNFPVVRAAFAEGFYPDTISSDLTSGGAAGCVKDLPTTMGKFLSLGMPLPDVVRAVTANPAKAIGRDGRLGTLRFTVAGLLRLPVLLRRRPAGAVGWRRVAALSVAAGAPYTLIMYAGLVLAPAAHGAVIVTGVTAVVTTALAWLWFGVRPWPARTAGLVLVVIGLTLVGSPGVGGGGHAWLGDALFIVAGVLFALFTVGARHWRVDPLPATAAVWVLALPYVPIYAAVAGPRVLEAPRGEVVFQALFQGLGVAIAALALYAWAIRVLGDARAALFMPLVPVFGVLLGVAVLDEVPTAVQVVGIAGV